MVNEKISNNNIFLYGAIAVGIVALFCMLNLSDIKTIQNLMQLSIAVAVFVFIYNKRTSTEDIIRLVIIAGLIMRVGYMLYTPVTVREHDFGGHLTYIKAICDGALPQGNGGQCYHPPLFHFLAAISASLIGNFKYDGEQIFEAAKLISCFASCVVLIVTRRIAEELNLNKRAVLIAVVITAFLPNFYFLGGRVNNDGLAVMFIYMTFLYTIKWYKQPCYRYVIFMALSIGLGMMTKMSAAMTAFFTGPIMLYVLFKSFKRDKKDLTIFKQLVVFALICFPLGMWYPIRNLVLFDQPFNYVMRLDESLSLYHGDVDIAKRALSLPIADGLKKLYNNSWEDYNWWIFLFKSCLFGEWSFDIVDFIPRVLTYIQILIVVAQCIGMAVVAASKRIAYFTKYVIFNIWLVALIPYISFNISFPFGCTQDFRYVVQLALVGSLSMGILYERLLDKKAGSRAATYALRAIEILCLMFALYSVMMYTTIN